jgi:hypothetical protein
MVASTWKWCFPLQTVKSISKMCYSGQQKSPLFAKKTYSFTKDDSVGCIKWWKIYLTLLYFQENGETTTVNSWALLPPIENQIYAFVAKKIWRSMNCIGFNKMEQLLTLICCFELVWLIDFWLYAVLAIFQSYYDDWVKCSVWFWKSGFPWQPQWAYSFLNIRETIFCVPRGLWSLTWGTI